MRRLVLVLASMVAAPACSSGSSPGDDVDAGRTVAESEIARLKLLGLRAHEKTVALDDTTRSAPVLDAGRAARFTRSGDALVPSFGVHVPDAARVRLELPSRASQPVILEDVSTHKAIRFALVGARDAAAELADGLVLYEGALPGGDLVHRPVPEGTEDYVFFERRPAREELRYRVDVSAFSGLRLVGNTVELLDRDGLPRLRVANRGSTTRTARATRAASRSSAAPTTPTARSRRSAGSSRRGRRPARSWSPGARARSSPTRSWSIPCGRRPRP